MAAFVQTIGSANNPQGTAASSLAVTIPSGGVPVGHRLIARFGRNGSTAGATGITDTAGNTWAKDIGYNGPANGAVEIWSAHVSTALASGNSITVAFPGSTNAVAFAVEDYSDIVATSAAYGGATSHTATTTQSAAVTVATVGDIVIGVGAAADKTTSAGSTPTGWTALPQVIAIGSIIISSEDLFGAYIVPGSTGAVTYNPTDTAAGATSFSAVVIAYTSTARVPRSRRTTARSPAASSGRF